MESQGFTICTQGKNKDNSEIKGEGTLRYFPHIAGIAKFGKSLIENLITSVSPSSKHRFDVVDLIDTPGMVDGNVKVCKICNVVCMYSNVCPVVVHSIRMTWMGCWNT